MNGVDRFWAVLLWLLGILTVAGITHIIAIFMLPNIVAKDVFARFLTLAKSGQAAVLPSERPEDRVLRFADPALAQTVCPYDLSEGGLRLHADVEADRLLTLSFRTLTGQIYYTMSDLAAQQGKIDVVVLTPAQLELVEADDDEDDPSQDLRLLAPVTQGFVIISALASFPGERAEAEARVKSVSCQVEHISQD